MTPCILVPLDGSEHARSALPVARALGALEGADLHVLHVGQVPEDPRGLLARLGVDPGPGTVVSATQGQPGRAILDAARRIGASSVVMCAHAGHPRAGRGLGSVAQQVVEGAPCPVVLVPPQRGEQPWTLGRVLLPQDGTPDASAAVEPAALLAARAGASLLALHVAGTRAGDPATTPRYVDQPQHEWPAWAQEFLDRISCGCGHCMGVRLQLVTGDPGDRIVEAARAADLVVVAWHGRLADDRAATLRALLAEMPCPVMLLRLAGEPARDDTPPALGAEE